MSTVNERKVIGTANVKIGDDVYNDIEIAHIEATKTYKGESKVSHYYTTAPIAEAGIKPTAVRLYLRRGMSEDFETAIKPLFEGETVHFENLPTASGSTYKGDFAFDATIYPTFLYEKGYKTYKGVLDFETKLPELREAQGVTA